MHTVRFDTDKRYYGDPRPDQGGAEHVDLRIRVLDLDLATEGSRTGDVGEKVGLQVSGGFSPNDSSSASSGTTEYESSWS